MKAHQGYHGLGCPDCAEHVRQVVDRAPPLSQAQLGRLAAILGPAVKKNIRPRAQHRKAGDDVA